MAIYVVTKGLFADHRIVGVTQDKDVANTLAEKFSDIHEKTEVSVYEDAKFMMKPCWFITFNEDGSVQACVEDSNNEFSYRHANHCRVDRSGNIFISVVADDKSAALKIAAEKRAEFLSHVVGLC